MESCLNRLKMAFSDIVVMLYMAVYQYDVRFGGLGRDIVDSIIIRAVEGT
jgi:hypothetical protein